MDLRHRRYYFMEEAGLEFRDVGKSPLKYDRWGDIQRLVVCDPSVTIPPGKHDKYFATTERKIFRNPETGRKFKNPRTEIDPGIEDNCVVAFLDWHKVGPEDYYLDYLKVRGDLRGKKYARALIDYFYSTHPKARYIDWGKMMQEEIGHLFKAMRDKYSKIGSHGKIFY